MNIFARSKNFLAFTTQPFWNHQRIQSEKKRNEFSMGIPLKLWFLSLHLALANFSPTFPASTFENSEIEMIHALAIAGRYVSKNYAHLLALFVVVMIPMQKVSFILFPRFWCLLCTYFEKGRNYFFSFSWLPNKH